MADNKVVIKINYDKDKQRKALIDPKMVTVWHKPRIFSAIAVLVFILMMLLTWLRDGETPVAENKIQPPAESVTIESVSNKGQAAVDVEGKLPESQLTSAKDKSSSIIFNTRVIRAALVKQIKDEQPGEQVNGPIQIPVNQSVEVFYFSQVKHMNDKVLFHQWFKDGKLAFKKQHNIKDNKAKLISSKALASKDEGQWQVLMVDTKGKRYSETNFTVIR